MNTLICSLAYSFKTNDTCYTFLFIYIYIYDILSYQGTTIYNTGQLCRGFILCKGLSQTRLLFVAGSLISAVNLQLACAD